MIGDTWHQQAAAGISEQDESRTAKEGRSGPYRKAMKECYKAYERSLAYRPDNPLVLNNYAYFLSLEERDLERALSMSSRVVALTDNNPTYLDTHAWVLSSWDARTKPRRSCKRPWRSTDRRVPN